MPQKKATVDVLEEVFHERGRQDQRWGGSDHDDAHPLATWEGLLTERLQKIRNALGINPRQSQQVDPRTVRRETVIMAALAVAMVEAMDRRAWSPAHFADGEEED